MEINNNSDKRALIWKAEYCPVSETSFVDYPGDKCRVTASFQRINFSDVSFTESDGVNGEPIEQNLQFIFRGQNKEFDQDVKKLTGSFNIIKLHYSNRDIRIVGTKDNPVIFSAVKSGRVVETTIESRRVSAEHAKYLIII